jgi:hypothetical protein
VALVLGGPTGSGAAEVPLDSGYWLAAADGGVFAFGRYPFYGSAAGRAPGPIAAIVPLCLDERRVGGAGYAVVAANAPNQLGDTRGILAFGERRVDPPILFVGFRGIGATTISGAQARCGGGPFPDRTVVIAATAFPCPPGVTGRCEPHAFIRRPLAAPIVGFSGEWFATADGGVFAMNAPFYGSMAGRGLRHPVVDIEATPTGRGYWLVASDGGVFAFGDAKFYGSTANLPLNKPVVAMRPTSSGRGYWLVAADGGVFAFGNAAFYGSLANLRLNAPIVDIA